jgi:GH3 auxin-responsive promoter
MKIKSFLARPFASYIHKQIRKSMGTALEDQRKILRELLKTGKSTEFGTEHRFQEIEDHEQFRQAVPLRDYEAFRPYIDKIKEGRHNVLWKGQPIYFAKTSGTTSGVKYIPISRESIPNHINTARNALLCYMAETGNHLFANGRMIFLSGSPELERVGGIPTGRLSGIVNHHIPSYLRTNQLPSYETNCIEDWETKLDKIVSETIGKDMTLISGIPPWMQMYFDRLIEKGGKSVKDLFPNFSVMVHGGVNFGPYRAKLMQSIGREVDTIETFPASEGFFAFQDRPQDEGLLLNTDSGIFFEFVPAGEILSEQPTRLSLKDVKVGEHYALIVNSNAGLWGYNIGDTIRFISVNPYRIVVTGRIKHFISAFGEHVIGEEVEYSLMKAATEENLKIVEFTVAPMIQAGQGRSYHEWFVEFEETPASLERFARKVDENLREKNIYYDDLIRGNILEPLVIRPLRRDAFIGYMKSIGKLGGQNKVPRLSNDRRIADALGAFIDLN